MTRQEIITAYDLTSIDTSLLLDMTSIIKSTLKANIATFSLYSETQGHVLTMETDKELAHLKVDSFDITDSVGIKSIEIKRPLFVEDTLSDARINQSHYIQDSFKIRSIAVFPIVHSASRKMLATISCFYTEHVRFSDDEKITFNEFGKMFSKGFNCIEGTQEIKSDIPTKAIAKHNHDLLETHRHGHDATAHMRAIKSLIELTGSTSGLLFSCNSNEELSLKSCYVDGKFIKLQNVDFESRLNEKSGDIRFLEQVKSRQNTILNSLDGEYRSELAALFPVEHEKIENCLGIPLLSRNKLFGVVALFNSTKQYSDEIARSLSAILGTTTSILVDDTFYHIGEYYGQQLANALTQDELTSIPNMAGGVNYLEKITSADDHPPFTFCLIDLDKFSHLNTVYSRYDGDHALITIVNRINESIRKDDFFARVGGDMLMLVFNGHQDELRIQEVLDIIAQPIDIQNECISIHASAAYLHGPIPDMTGERHFSYLLDPIYKAKQFERIEFADTPNIASISKEIEFLKDINYAVVDNQIELYGLPAFNIDSKEIICIEVLARWNHPNEGILMPVYFLNELAKDNASLALFDYAIVKKSINFLLNLEARSKPFPMLCINISPALLADSKIEDLLEYFKNDISRDIAENICFELIEWDEHVDNELMIKRLNQFKAIGIKVALDDYGTGYSNTDRLLTFPIDIVKIDRSFTFELEKNAVNQDIIKYMYGICNTLNKSLIVEGIENKEQADILKEMGCMQAQGFYFQKPAPLEQFAK